MVAMATPDMEKAIQFLAANARVVDRRQYERLFEGGAAQPMRDALAAYRNGDGGFGHALEPDGRAPTSEPIAAEVALHLMDETDVWDDDIVAGCSARWPRPPRPKAASCSCTTAWPSGRTPRGWSPTRDPGGWTGPRRPRTSRPA